MTATQTVKQAKKPIDFIGYFLRIMIILTLVSLFVPALNPTHMSELMNDGDSFFTSGISYGGIAGGFQRAINRGYIEKRFCCAPTSARWCRLSVWRLCWWAAQ